MSETRSDEWLTPEQVAAMLQVKRSTVLDWARQETLPGFKIGRYWRFSRRQVDGHMERLAAEAVNPYR